MKKNISKIDTERMSRNVKKFLRKNQDVARALEIFGISSSHYNRATTASIKMSGSNKTTLMSTNKFTI